MDRDDRGKRKEREKVEQRAGVRNTRRGKETEAQIEDLQD